jgi:hypothetical protein
MSHRITPGLLAAIVLSLLQPAVKGADKSGSNRLTIPDICSIDAPGKSWTWKAVKEYDAEKGGGAYVCSAEDKPGKIFLTIDAKKYATDKDRINALKVAFNALHNQLQSLGCTEIKGKRPNITPPIGEDVDYFVFGKKSAGSSIYFAAHTIFKDHTFQVQSVAPSLEQAQKLEEVEKTLK